MKVIGLFEDLPPPTSKEEVIIKGEGTIYEIYSTSEQRGGILVWKLVGWS